MNRRSFLKTIGLFAAALVPAKLMATEEIPVIQPEIVPEGFRLGYDAMDELAGGWDRGSLVAICSLSREGKSVLARYCAMKNAQDGHKVAIVTDEYGIMWNGFKRIEISEVVNNKSDLLIIDESNLEYSKDLIGSKRQSAIYRSLRQIAIDNNQSIVITKAIRPRKPSNLGESFTWMYCLDKIYTINHGDLCVLKNRNGRNGIKTPMPLRDILPFQQ